MSKIRNIRFNKLGITIKEGLDCISGWHDSYKDLYPGYSADSDYQDDYMFASKEVAFREMYGLLSFFEGLGEWIPIYRSIYAREESDINLDWPGESWSYEKKSAISFGLNQNRGNFLLSGEVHRTDIDWHRTITLHYEFSVGFDGYDENELYVQNPNKIRNISYEKMVAKSRLEENSVRRIVRRGIMDMFNPQSEKQ